MGDVTPWLDGFQRVVFAESLGLPWAVEPRGIGWHTTEGYQATHAFGVYANTPGGACPHFTAQPDDGTRFQHVPLDLAAYAFERGQGCKVETNRAGIVQIELVGFAHDTAGWPDPVLQWIGETVLAPILAACPNIPDDVYQGDRMTDKIFKKWGGGHLGHRDMPCQPAGHSDPGDLNIPRIIEHAREALMTQAQFAQWLAASIGSSDVARTVLSDAGSSVVQVKLRDVRAEHETGVVPQWAWTDVAGAIQFTHLAASGG